MKLPTKVHWFDLRVSLFGLVVLICTIPTPPLTGIFFLCFCFSVWFGFFNLILCTMLADISLLFLFPSGNSLKGSQTSLATNNIFKGSINQKKIYWLNVARPIHGTNHYWTLIIIKTGCVTEKSKSRAPQKEQYTDLLMAPKGLFMAILSHFSTLCSWALFLHLGKV